MAERQKRKVTIRIFEEDKETLERFFPRSGYNLAVRKLVERAASKLRERESQSGIIEQRQIARDSIEEIADDGEK